MKMGRTFLSLADFLLLCRHFEEKAEALEEVKRQLQGRVEDLEEENDHLRRQQLMESEAKSKLREETSRLTAENMVRVDKSVWVLHLSTRKSIKNFTLLPGL